MIHNENNIALNCYMSFTVFLHQKLDNRDGGGWSDSGSGTLAIERKLRPRLSPSEDGPLIRWIAVSAIRKNNNCQIMCSGLQSCANVGWTQLKEFARTTNRYTCVHDAYRSEKVPENRKPRQSHLP